MWDNIEPRRKEIAPTNNFEVHRRGRKINNKLHKKYLFGAQLSTNAIHAEHGQEGGGGGGVGVRLVSGSHHSHTSPAPFAMSREVSASLVFGTVLAHTRVSVIKSSGLLSFIFYHSAN